jgi:hypothetical protein
MTARAGDALSHVNFNWLPRQFSKPTSKPISKPTSKPIFKHPFAANRPPRFAAWHAHSPNSGVSLKLEGSYRICMVAMSLVAWTESGSLQVYLSRLREH